MSQSAHGGSGAVLARFGRGESGSALIMVLLIILVLVSVAGIMTLGINRNTELGAGFQKNVAGLHAAESGLNVGAAQVLTAMQNYGLPTNCNAQTLVMSGRIVTYTLSVPGGTAGSCAETPTLLTMPAGDPFEGLQAEVYTYNLASTAVNLQGYTEANASMQFQARYIPLFQFLAFYMNDLETSPAPPAIYNGRMHTNGDMYLNTEDCSSGLHILGQITIVGSGNAGTAPLNRGWKDSNSAGGQVWISLDGTNTNVQILGLTAPGDTSCSWTTSRQVAQSEINTWRGRVRTGVKTINRPGESALICTPWTTCPGGTTGTYWQRADLRIVLDTTTTAPLVVGPPAKGPSLYPVEVLNADGTIDATRTNSLKAFMINSPGAITYSDLPKTTGNWDCATNSTCESTAYNSSTQYSPSFGPPLTQLYCIGTGYLSVRTGPRQTIQGNNYCYDYRYGGFYNWREMKPILMLNIDWMALEEWNKANSNALFDPAGTANNGLVIFLSVRGANSNGANNYGVRVYDAARLRYGNTDLGVAFASDQAFYLTGTFNCSSPNVSGGSSVPATCGSNGQKPASVTADTVNVLSCGWIQSQACAVFSQGSNQWVGVGVLRPIDERSSTGAAYSGPMTGGQPASGPSGYADIVNAAFLAGVDKAWCTGNSSGVNCDTFPNVFWYDGGLENYPRFHEDWTGQNFYYQGSFVGIGAPLHTCYPYITQWTSTADDAAYSCAAHATTPPQGFWGSARYVAPNRNWFYDVSFNTVPGLPPLTPRSISLKEVYFTELFQ